MSCLATRRSGLFSIILLTGFIHVIAVVHAMAGPPVEQTQTTQPVTQQDIDYPVIIPQDSELFDPTPFAEPMPLGRPNPPGVEYTGPSLPTTINRQLVEEVLEELRAQDAEAQKDEWLVSPPPPDNLEIVETNPEDEFDPNRAFGALTHETRPWRLPRKFGVKLFMNHNGAWRGCSGTMVDSLHVLTAAHCMYPPQVGTWPTQIQVIPGYRVIGGNGYQPYGIADWTNVWYYNSWINSVQANITNPANPLAWDDDICIVRLDRHIGALTSWMQFGSGTNCAFYTGKQHHSAGYPAGQFESPVGTCNRGRQQFYWRGRFDDCDTNWLGNWTGHEITFNTESWNGQSGSGIYFIDAQNRRIISSVLSNGTCGGNNPTCPNPNCTTPVGSPKTNCVRFNSARFTSMNNYIQSSIPVANDLVPLAVRVDQRCLTTCIPPAPEQANDPNCNRFCPVPVVPNGRRIPYIDFIVNNYCRFAYAGPIAGRYYLSSDRNITDSDILLGTFSATTNLTGRQNVRIVEAGAITIPTNLAAGDYYLGVKITTANSVTSNDITGLQDVARIDVVPSGACCIFQLTCVPLQSLEECLFLEGIYQGDGTNCDANPCGNTGACCNPETGACEIRTPASCNDLGHQFQGLNTSCHPNPCPQPPPGACCNLFSPGTCFITSKVDCEASGFHYVGNGTSCDPDPCPVQISGACCDLRSGACSLKTQAQCNMDPVHFFYQGDGIPCTPNPCPPAAGGACCKENGDCSVRFENECVAGNETYMGLATTCDPNPCPEAVPGACCAGDGACTISDEDTCDSNGGLFAGPFTDCDPNPCQPLPTGACCNTLDASCTVEYAHICQQLGGDYQGDGTDCQTHPCPVLPTGACCDVTGQCLETTQGFCLAHQGVYDGDGTSCLPNPCPPVTTGACCDADGECAVIREIDCQTLSGTYLGDGTDCSNNPCDSVPTGSCCDIDGGCTVLPYNYCLAVAGTYLGDFTDCQTTPCPQPTLGACCQPSGYCSVRSEASCLLVNGTYRGDATDCTMQPCPCGDFDRNLAVDGDDFSLLLMTFGVCGEVDGRTATPLYNGTVDMDADGCITFVDYQLWLQCYRIFLDNPLAPPPIPGDVGDLNADHAVNGLDIQPFIRVMTAPSTAGFRERFVADFDANGTINTNDVNALVGALLQAMPQEAGT